jgi:hypothetical protein
MRASFRNRLLIVVLLASVALSGCALFDSDDDDTPTTPLLANVVLVGNATVQANAAGFAEYLGEVVNNGGVTANNVRVSVNVFNGSDDLIDVATSSTVPANLPVQQVGTFKVTTSTPVAQAIRFEIVIEWD